MSKNELEHSELQKFTFPPVTSYTENDLVTETALSKHHKVSVKGVGTPKSSTEKQPVQNFQSCPISSPRIAPFKLSTPNSHSNGKTDQNKVDRQTADSGPQKRESPSLLPWPLKSSPLKQPPILRGVKEQQLNAHPSRSHTPEGGHHIRVGGLRSRSGYGSSVPTQHHTFPLDGADVQQIEKKLLQLMVDFEAGHLNAFSQDSRLRQMEEIREQQEKLAKLHFDIGADQELYLPLSEEGLTKAEENMKKLMNKLANLSESIENLHTHSHFDRKTSFAERRASSSTFLPSSCIDSSVVSPIQSKVKLSQQLTPQPSQNDYKASSSHRAVTKLQTSPPLATNTKAAEVTHSPDVTIVTPSEAQKTSPSDTTAIIRVGQSAPPSMKLTLPHKASVAPSPPIPHHLESDPQKSKRQPVAQ